MDRGMGGRVDGWMGGGWIDGSGGWVGGQSVGPYYGDLRVYLRVYYGVEVLTTYYVEAVMTKL